MCAPVEIDGKQYVDGGVSCAIPLFDDLPFACEKLVLVLTRAKGYRKTVCRKRYRSFIVIISKIAGHDRPSGDCPLRYNEAMDKIDALEHEGKVFVIRPQKPVNVSRVEKDVDKLVALYQDGRRDMEFAYRDLMALQQE